MPATTYTPKGFKPDERMRAGQVYFLHVCFCFVASGSRLTEIALSIRTQVGVDYHTLLRLGCRQVWTTTPSCGLQGFLKEGNPQPEAVNSNGSGGGPGAAMGPQRARTTKPKLSPSPPLLGGHSYVRQGSLGERAPVPECTCNHSWGH